MINKHVTFERNQNNIYCYLQPNPNISKKLIGTIDLIYKKLYIKINNPDEEYNSSAIIGINNELLKLKEFDHIDVQVGNYCFETSKNFFIKNSLSRILPGNEIQKFMCLKLFGMDLTEKQE